MIELPKSAYAPQVGALAGLPQNGAMTWYTCREQFHNAIIASKGRNFLFSCPDKTKVVKFMDEVQDRINLANHLRLRFVDTSIATVLCVEAGEWWTAQSVRLSFLTALLRAGQNYDGEDFQTALYSQVYTTETKPAVDRFLSGYTHFLGHGGQWHATFCNYKQKIDYAERMLVKEKDAKVSEEAMLEAKHIVATAKGNDDVLTFMLAMSLDTFYRNGRSVTSTARKTMVFGEKINE